MLILALGSSMPQAAPGPVLNEKQFRASALYNLLPYVTTWPRGDGPLVLGLYGQDPFGGLVQRLFASPPDKGPLKGRQIKVLVVRDSSMLAQCHVVFVPSSLAPRWNQIARVPGQLTVGEDRRFVTTMGGICSLTFPARKMEINRKNAKAAKVRFSSRLSKLIIPVD